MSLNKYNQPNFNHFQKMQVFVVIVGVNGFQGIGVSVFFYVEESW